MASAGPEPPTDQQAAFETLYVALVTLARLLAPVLPFLSETLYQNLVRSVDPTAPDSVHLTGYPAVVEVGQKTKGESPSLDANPLTLALGPSSEEPRLLADMQIVRRVVGLGRVARKSAGLRVRQPLARMLVVIPGGEQRAALARHIGDLLDELNVKVLEILDSSATLLRYRVKPNLRLLGPRLGRLLPTLRVRLDAMDVQEAGELARTQAAGAPVTLYFDDNSVTLAPDELLVESAALEGYAVAQAGDTQVALDTTLSEELRREGFARDMVRAIQEARKSAGLALSDHMTLFLAGDRELSQILAEWGSYVRGETLADELRLGAPPEGAYVETLALERAQVTIGIVRRS
jgi:isoleucyl-tRNA synthetase